jgi:hypothetical protein
MKNFVYLLLSLVLLSSCSSTKKSMSPVSNDTSYLIKKIDKKNSWYIVYAGRKDTLYKIVSYSDIEFGKDCKKIVVGRLYDFDLKSKKENAPMIGDIKLDAVGYTGCYQFDDKTTIFLEPKRGIYDLYYTNNLKGICYVQ